MKEFSARSIALTIGKFVFQKQQKEFMCCGPEIWAEDFGVPLKKIPFILTLWKLQNTTQLDSKESLRARARSRWSRTPQKAQTRTTESGCIKKAWLEKERKEKTTIQKRSPPYHHHNNIAFHAVRTVPPEYISHRQKTDSSRRFEKSWAQTYGHQNKLHSHENILDWLDKKKSLLEKEKFFKARATIKSWHSSGR